jgi:major inositol transporter-like SP family MFS transporter
MFLIGLFGSALPHSLIALSCWLLPNGPLKGWFVLAGMLLFLTLQQGAIMTVSWLLLTEMFPLRVRGLAVGLCFWFSWMNNFLTNMLFPLSVNGFGYPITFALIVCLCCTAGLFVLLCVPETRGKSLEQIEIEFKKGGIDSQNDKIEE